MSLRRCILRSYFCQSKLASCTAPIAVKEQKQKYRGNNREHRYFKLGARVLLGSVLIGAGSLSDQIDNKKTRHPNPKTAKTSDSTPFEAGAARSDLPTYRAEEVSKHDSKSSFWVTYKHGVYDVTSFLASHPGGEQILNAAGLSIEPFWNVYGMHKTQEVYELLETYRIGNLHSEDVAAPADDELWAREPRRDPRLLVKTSRPFNAEIPPQYQIQHFYTPNELFYVRQHMPVPELESSTHKLRITVVGRGVSTNEFTLGQLQQFPRRTVTAALMCAGNRRSEMVKEVTDKQVKGIDWAGGAVSNAVWSGVYLRDVLVHCGVDVDDTEGKHVIFQGADIDATGVNFSTSIPLSMAVNPQGEILLATHMNGSELPPDHGYPLRVVVPGAPAVRSVKWLESITVSEKESPSHWHQRDYRSFNSSQTWESADFPAAPPVYSLPVTSAVCAPERGGTAAVRGGHIEARGYAYAGGGARVVRVDVSADGGAAWHEAALRADGRYGWTLWRASVPVPSAESEVEIWVKATDSNFNTQPERFEHIWNIRGILGNAYHRVKVKLEH